MTISPPKTKFFEFRTVVLGLFKLNIKARHVIREFLNANLWSIHLIAINRLELKLFHFTQFLLNAHRVAHQFRKRKNWELEILDRYTRSSYVWLVSNTADHCLQRQIAQKIFKSKIEARPADAGHYYHRLHGLPTLHFMLPTSTWLQTLIVIDSESCQTMADIISWHLHSAMWGRCAVGFKFEQTPFPQTGRRFRSAVFLHRIRFGTCVFVPLQFHVVRIFSRPLGVPMDGPHSKFGHFGDFWVLHRNVVQPPNFVTCLKKKKACFHLVTCWPVAPAGI